MAPLPINKTIADKRITRHPSIIDYETALTKAGFKAKVAEWAKATSAGLSYHTVAVFGYDQVNKIKREPKKRASFSLYARLICSPGISSPDRSCDPLRKNSQDCDGAWMEHQGRHQIHQPLPLELSSNQATFTLSSSRNHRMALVVRHPTPHFSNPLFRSPHAADLPSLDEMDRQLVS